MPLSKPIRWTLHIIGGLIASLFLIIILLAFIPITIDLSDYRAVAESAATLAPTAKKPEYFSLATPIEVKGSKTKELTRKVFKS